jgi:hypothetical protein
MSRYGALVGLPWDDNCVEEDDEMNLFESRGGDSKMSSPSAPKAVSGLPTFPPQPVTPTRGAGKGKHTKRDQMRLAHLVSVLNRIATNNGWHTMLFEDTPNAPTLASECRGLFPTPGSTLDTTHRSADKAGPQTQTPSLPPACRAPLETTARPSHAQPGPLPPRPPWSDRHPPPPGPLSRKSYADTFRDVTALVNLAKTMPDLPSDCILAMYKASLPPPSNKHRINLTTSGPSRCQVLLQLDPLPPASKFPAIVSSVNRILSKGNLQVDSCYTAYGGLTLLTTHVTTQAEIDLITTAIQQTLAPRGFLSSSWQVSDDWPWCEDQSIAGSTELASSKLLLSDPSTSSADIGECLDGPLLCG